MLVGLHYLGWRMRLPARRLLLPAAVLLAAMIIPVYAPASSLSASSPQDTASASGSSAPSTAASSANGPQGVAPFPEGKKLILTDGSYQLVREYEREGDRVRYYSVERSAWEEIPASLVDWAATEKAEAERQAAAKALDKKLANDDLAARVADIDSDKSYEVRPGVILPDAVGLYALADDQVRPLEQSLATSNASKARAAERIASGVPLIPTKATLEVRPKHAKLRIRAGELEFYFRTADGRDPKLELLKAEVESDRRKLESMTTNFAGQNKYKGNQINLLSTEVAHGLYRFTLQQNLAPGEYALVELTRENDVDLYVWDFGVDMVSGNAGAFLRNVEVK